MMVQSTYSSALTANSTTFSRVGHCKESSYHYYEVLQVTIVTPGFYNISSDTRFNPYGYFYEDNFNPFNLSEKFHLENDHNCRAAQFKFITQLQASTAYLLVVTTYHPDVTGEFSILVSGPNNVSLNRISEYMY